MGDLPELEWDERHAEVILSQLHVPFSAEHVRIGYFFENSGVLQQCIHAMKYQEMHSIAKWFGRLLGERLIGTPFIDGDPVLVPVPLHKMKYYERGYNQSEWLCKGIAFETGLAMNTKLLTRTRYTKSQAASKLDADERQANVKNAFMIDGSGANTHPTSVILVDDLITTGATTSECIAALNAGGISDVRVLALASPIRMEITDYRFEM